MLSVISELLLLTYWVLFIWFNRRYLSFCNKVKLAFKQQVIQTSSESKYAWCRLVYHDRQNVMKPIFNTSNILIAPLKVRLVKGCLKAPWRKADVVRTQKKKCWRHISLLKSQTAKPASDHCLLHINSIELAKCLNNRQKCIQNVIR